MKVKSKRQVALDLLRNNWVLGEFDLFGQVLEFNVYGKQLFLWDTDFGIYYKSNYQERYPERYYHNSVQWNNIKLLDNE